MGLLEYNGYVNRTLSDLNERTTKLYESMMDKNDDEVLEVCQEIIEIIELIKEYHTDEKLLP